MKWMVVMVEEPRQSETFWPKRGTVLYPVLESYHASYSRLVVRQHPPTWDPMSTGKNSSGRRPSSWPVLLPSSLATGSTYQIPTAYETKGNKSSDSSINEPNSNQFPHTHTKKKKTSASTRKFLAVSDETRTQNAV